MSCPLPTSPNPNPWINYQPDRQRDKEIYDIELRDGTIVMSCYPNADSWTPMWFKDRFDIAKTVGRGPIRDYRVVRIRRTHPDPFSEL